jgi:hypothetical protein
MGSGKASGIRTIVSKKEKQKNRNRDKFYEMRTSASLGAIFALPHTSLPLSLSLSLSLSQLNYFLRDTQASSINTSTSAQFFTTS